MDVRCPHCRSVMDASSEEIGVATICPVCGATFVPSIKTGIKEYAILSARWVGAAILPLIACCVVSLFVKLNVVSIRNHFGGSDILVEIASYVIEGLAEGFVIPTASYWSAPKFKFGTALVVTTVYATLLAVVFTLCTFSRGFSISYTIQCVLLIAGMVWGLLHTAKSE